MPRKPASTTRPARPAPPEIAVDLADRLHSVAIHLLRRLRQEDAATGVPPRRLSALSVIVFRGPLTVGELARAEQVRSPTMTRLVGGLERAGLAERVASPDDGRAVLVRATPLGARVLDQGRRRRVERLAEALVSIPAGERARLAGALDTLESIVGPRRWPVGRADAGREGRGSGA